MKDCLVSTLTRDQTKTYDPTTWLCMYQIFVHCLGLQDSVHKLATVYMTLCNLALIIPGKDMLLWWSLYLLVTWVSIISASVMVHRNYYWSRSRAIALCQLAYTLTYVCSHTPNLLYAWSMIQIPSLLPISYAAIYGICLASRVIWMVLPCRICQTVLS